MKAIFFPIFSTAFYNFIMCTNNLENPLPEFRRRVEEILDEKLPPVESTEDPSQNIVSFLIQNVKEIFKDTYDSDDEEETQTDSVNVLKRKENVVEATDNYDNLSDGGVQTNVEMVADEFEKQNSSTDKTARTIIDNNNLSVQKDFNVKIFDKQKNEEDPYFKPVQYSFRKMSNLEQDDKNDVELQTKNLQEFRKSTLFRPIFAFATRSEPDYSTEIYFKSRRTTTLIFAGTALRNISDSDTDENFVTIPFINYKYNDNNISLDAYKHADINALPFLSNNQKIITNRINTGKGLMFLAAGSELTERSQLKANVIRTTVLTTKITRTTVNLMPVKADLNSEAHLKQSERSCIRCNNAVDDWCSAPKNKLIPSTICSLDGDICYSMHTPFGIVERGCFNINHNMTTYVCGCNLCNYVAFTDMPVMFSSKHEWIQNIFDLSHLRSLTRSTMKTLNCLHCEVNSTSRTNLIYNTNCLDGHLGVFQTVKCQEDEICGIRTLKDQGYIWRGCVSAPLYNYYITLCDSDLCNYDPIASVYDIND